MKKTFFLGLLVLAFAVPAFAESFTQIYTEFDSEKKACEVGRVGDMGKNHWKGRFSPDAGYLDNRSGLCTVEIPASAGFKHCVLSGINFQSVKSHKHDQYFNVNALHSEDGTILIEWYESTDARFLCFED